MMVVVVVMREAATGADTASTARIRRLAGRDPGTSLGWLEVGPKGVVAALSVPRNLDGEELQLGYDHRVLPCVVLATVQPQQTLLAVIINILLESLAEFSPLFRGYFIFNIIFNKFVQIEA